MNKTEVLALDVCWKCCRQKV